MRALTQEKNVWSTIFVARRLLTRSKTIFGGVQFGLQNLLGQAFVWHKVKNYFVKCSAFFLIRLRNVQLS